MMRLIAIASLLFVAGCAGTETHVRMMENENAVRVDVADSPNYDYTVHIRNVVDLGYNPDNPETRQQTALLALRSQCPAGRIAGERVIDRGSYVLGRPARTYIMQVKCSG